MSREVLRRKALQGLLWCVSGGMPAVAVAQQNPSRTFDIDRAYVIDTLAFQPFYVTETRLLRDALRDRTIHRGTPLLVMEHEGGTLAVLTEQMAYHHIAQGDIDGEPWMVSF